MFTDDAKLAAVLDRELIGFLTAVHPSGQPQTSPVWFIRDADDIVVYNHPNTQRLRSIAVNPFVSFNLRGDLRANGSVLLEGIARAGGLPPAKDFPGYVDKYETEIERFGWTVDSFSADYSEGLTITVTRIRSWGLDALDRQRDSTRDG